MYKICYVLSESDIVVRHNVSRIQFRCREKKETKTLFFCWVNLCSGQSYGTVNLELLIGDTSVDWKKTLNCRVTKHTKHTKQIRDENKNENVPSKLGWRQNIKKIFSFRLNIFHSISEYRFLHLKLCFLPFFIVHARLNNVLTSFLPLSSARKSCKIFWIISNQFHHPLKLTKTTKHPFSLMPNFGSAKP